ncbi:MAG TPA: DUF1385 domain-containing protein [Anaerolineae bacterium]|nr:DUF1385 domain-containing protein [Anaerolineae bacterium]
MSEFYYGGQAVIEGVMMRGQRRVAVAVRNPEGEIVVHEEPLPERIYRSAWSRMPFLRGLVLLWDALVLGTKALMWSADVAMGEEETQGFSGPVAWGTLALSLALGIALFFLLPTGVAHLSESWLGLSKYTSAMLEGVFRLILFIAYLVIIARSEEIKRVFMYHGAEHKTINAYEAGEIMTPENVAKYSTRHTRCGTSFLLFVVLISIILFIPLQFDIWWLRLISRLFLIPVVAGISYEVLRLSTRYQQNPLMKLVISPGLAMQRLTTREPTLDMLEVAIQALAPVVAADGLTLPGVEDERVEMGSPHPELAPSA